MYFPFFLLRLLRLFPYFLHLFNFFHVVGLNGPETTDGLDLNGFFNNGNLRMRCGFFESLNCAVVLSWWRLIFIGWICWLKKRFSSEPPISAVRAGESEFKHRPADVIKKSYNHSKRTPRIWTRRSLVGLSVFLSFFYFLDSHQMIRWWFLMDLTFKFFRMLFQKLVWFF